MRKKQAHRKKTTRRIQKNKRIKNNLIKNNRKTQYTRLVKQRKAGVISFSELHNINDDLLRNEILNEEVDEYINSIEQQLANGKFFITSDCCNDIVDKFIKNLYSTMYKNMGHLYEELYENRLVLLDNIKQIEHISNKYRALSRHRKGSHHTFNSRSMFKKTSKTSKTSKNNFKNINNNLKDVFMLAKLIKEIINYEINERK